MNDQLSLLDFRIGEYLDALMVLLLTRYENTLLPELAGVFGKEKVALFLQIFAGTTFKVPSPEIVRSLIMEADIYTTYTKDPTSKPTLATRYNITQAEVLKVYGEVKKVVEGVVNVEGKAS